jgi:hypothetical protein
MPNVTFRGDSRRDVDTGSVQVTVDGKDYLFPLDRAVEDVPQEVVKQLEAESHHKYDIDSGAKTPTKGE